MENNSDRPTLSISQKTGYGRVVLHGPWETSYADFFLNADYQSLTINTSRGFSGSDLDFLEEVPNLKELAIFGSINDVSAIGSVDSLEILNIQVDCKFGADLQTLQKLEELFVDDKSARGFEALPVLQSLYVYGFSGADLSRFTCGSLKALRIGPARKLTSLSGLSDSLNAQISDLGVYYAPRLVDYLPLERMLSLETLEFDHCKICSYSGGGSTRPGWVGCRGGARGVIGFGGAGAAGVVA